MGWVSSVGSPLEEQSGSQLLKQLKQSWRAGGRGAVCWVCSIRLGPQPGKEGVGGGERLALAEPWSRGSWLVFSVPFFLSVPSPRKAFSAPLSPSRVKWGQSCKAVMILWRNFRGAFPLGKLSNALQTQNRVPSLGPLLVFPSLPWKSPCCVFDLYWHPRGPVGTAQECPAETLGRLSVSFLKRKS